MIWDACPRHKPKPRQLRLIVHDAIVRHLVEPDRQCHEFGDARHPAGWSRRLRLGAGRDLLPTWPRSHRELLRRRHAASSTSWFSAAGRPNRNASVTSFDSPSNSSCSNTCRNSSHCSRRVSARHTPSNSANARRTSATWALWRPVVSICRRSWARRRWRSSTSAFRAANSSGRDAACARRW
jgi:hypothetical protein